MKRALAPLTALALLASCGPPRQVDHTVNATGPTTTTSSPPFHDPTTGIHEALARATTTTRPSRSRSRPTNPSGHATGGTANPAQPRAYGVRLVSSTAYCLTGTMANGQRVYAGAVAMNGEPFGSRWLVHTGPLAGQTLTVADRIGHSSAFDIAMPADCPAAIRYGRRQITIERVA